jgi:hypothetical protein
LPVALVRIADRIDIQAGNAAAPDPEFCAALARDESAAYAGFSDVALTAMWPKLLAARADALSTLAR